MASTALATLFDWWWPAMFGTRPPDAARQDFAAALETTLAPVAAGPTCFVHRDFFAGNLIWLPRPRRHPPHRHPGLPGCRHRSPRLRPRLLVAGRSPRHPVRPRRARHRPLPGCPSRTGSRKLPRRLCRLRRATPPAHRRPMGAPRPPRWPPGLSAPRPPHLAPAGTGRAEPAAAPLAAALDRWIPPHRAATHRTSRRDCRAREPRCCSPPASAPACGPTDRTAKPLLPLGGRPLIDHALDRLAEAGWRPWW